MKKVWKWILGIVIGLVVLAILVGVGFALSGRMHAARVGLEIERGWYLGGPGMMPFGGHMRYPGMMRGFGFFPFGGILGGLISLGFIALIVLGIIWLVRALRGPRTVVQTPASAAATSEPVAMTACKNCGKPLQAEWKNCPYCGKKV